MIHLKDVTGQFKYVTDRNGVKVHIGEQALIINNGTYLKCQVCGFSQNYNYVYLIANEQLFKRAGKNIVLINRLNKWNHNYQYHY